MIEKLIKEAQVVLLDGSSREEVLQQLVARARLEPARKEALLKAVLQREQLISTAVGFSVAIPHAKLDELDHFFLILGVMKEGVEWQAIDQVPVRLAFLIAGPKSKPTEYLQILSELTFLIKREEIRKKLLQLSSEESILTAMVEAASGLKS